MNKKADTTMLQFLMRLILALIIFIPVVMFASKFISFSNNAAETLDAVNLKIDDLEKNPTKIMTNVPLRFNGRDGAIISFSKTSNSVELVFDGKTKSFSRPGVCAGTCYCICSEKFKEKKDTGVMDCNGDLLCKSLDSYEFLSPFSFKKDGKDAVFKGGFFWVFESGTNTLYVRQAGKDICFSPVSDFGCGNLS